MDHIPAMIQPSTTNLTRVTAASHASKTRLRSAYRLFIAIYNINAATLTQWILCRVCCTIERPWNVGTDAPILGR
jgi:hypothetical protein